MEQLSANLQNRWSGGNNISVVYSVAKPLNIEEGEDLFIDLGPIRKEKIVGAVKKMKSGKAEGPDSIPPEVLTTDPEATADTLISLLQEAWDREEIPEEWRMGYMVKLPKIGRSQCA